MPHRSHAPLALAGALLAILLGAASPAHAQSFYVMVVEWEGVSEPAAVALEAEIPAMARRCVTGGSARRFALGQRVAVVDVGADGRASDVELRSDDVSPSGLETAFGRCMERALAARPYEVPASQPAVIEIAFEYAATVPTAHAPGGSGPRRGARRAHPPQHHAQGTGLPPERVREVASQHAAEIERCVHGAVEGTRSLSGRIELETTVLPDGHVEMVAVVQSTTGVPRFDECVAASARTWVFPAPGARVAIRYPLTVASDVATTPPPAPPPSAPPTSPAPR
jgi:hypothetical protein